MTANWKIVRSTLVWLLIALMTMGIVIASPYVIQSEAASAKQTVTVAKADGKWGAVKNGKIDTSVTGVYQNSYGWWYVKNGLVQFGYNGIQKNQYGWWRIEKGKVNFTATGVYENEYGWWRVEDGKVNFKANKIYQNKYGWWKTTDGKVTFKENGVFKNDYGWWKVVNSKVDFDYTGVAKNKYGWWRIENGKVNFKFNGIASNEYGQWYIVDGKVDFNKNGIVEYKGVKYQVTEGKAEVYKEKSKEELKAEAVEVAIAVSDEKYPSRQALINAMKTEYPDDIAIYAVNHAEELNKINFYTNALFASDEILGDWTEKEFKGVSEALYLKLMKDELLFTEDEIEYMQSTLNSDNAKIKVSDYWLEQCKAAAEGFKADSSLQFNKANLEKYLTGLLFTNNQVNNTVADYFS